MAVIKAGMLSALAATLLISLFLYAALQAGESRCADLGGAVNKETHLLANGYCLVVTGGESSEQLP